MGAVVSSEAVAEGPDSPFRRIGSWSADSGRVRGRFEIERVGPELFCWVWRELPMLGDPGTLSPEVYVAFSQRRGAIRLHEMTVVVPDHQLKGLEPWRRDQLSGELGGYLVHWTGDGFRFTPLRLQIHPRNQVRPVSKEWDLERVTLREVSVAALEPWLKNLGAYVLPEPQ